MQAMVVPTQEGKANTKPGIRHSTPGQGKPNMHEKMGMGKGQTQINKHHTYAHNRTEAQCQLPNPTPVPKPGLLNLNRT